MAYTRLLTLAAVALLLFAGACTRSNSPSNTNTPSTTPSNTTTAPSTTNRTVTTNSAATNTTTTAPALTVVISQAGLQPAQPMVTAGARVTFQNADSAVHQIASNPHPAHSDLPGFEVNLSPGASQSFTFSQAGTWGFHDHLDPTNTRFQGRIQVAP